MGENKEDSEPTSAICVRDALEVEDDAEDAIDEETGVYVWMKKALKDTNMGLEIDEESIEVRVQVRVLSQVLSRQQMATVLFARADDDFLRSCDHVEGIRSS